MIKILKAINFILSNDTGVQNIVVDQIFPNAVPDEDVDGNKINNPVIMMIRSEVGAEYSKNCKNEIAAVTIVCWADSYFQGAELADAVNTALEFYKGTVEGIRISTIRLVSGREGYVEHAFQQELVYSIR